MEPFVMPGFVLADRKPREVEQIPKPLLVEREINCPTRL